MDLGVQWSAPELLTWTGIENMIPDKNGNATLIPGLTGDDLILLFCNNYKRIYCCTSSDFGQAWNTPVDIQIQTTIEGYTWIIIAVGPGRGIRTLDGRRDRLGCQKRGRCQPHGCSHRPEIRQHHPLEYPKKLRPDSSGARHIELPSPV
jgi:hypothetical protein